MDVKNVLIFISAVVSLILAIFIYWRDKKNKINRSFLILTINASIWTFSMFLYRNSYGNTLLMYSKFLYASAAYLPISFLFLSRYLVSGKYIRYVNFYKIFFFTITTLYLLIFNSGFSTYTLITGVVNNASLPEPIIYFNSYLYAIYSFLISFPILLVVYYLYKTYLITKDDNKKIVIFFVGFGVLIPASISMITNLILPFFGYYVWNWVGQLSVAIAPVVIVYGIVKYKIFKIELLLADLLVFILIIQSFLTFIISNSTSEYIRDALILILNLVIGVWLIRNVESYVKVNKLLNASIEKMNRLNAHLEEISQKKTEFLSIATHQLRAPVAIIKGQLSLILEGSYGKLPEEIKKPLKKVYLSSERMANTITDFLNVSRIEQGRMEYIFSEVNLTELVKSVYNELINFAKEKGLELKIELCKDMKKDIFIHADKDKIRHVLFNLVENAIKYTENGFVQIEMCKSGPSRVKIAVKDTGVGIDKEDLDNLFDKFIRAKNVYGVNVEGTGLGLYIAREIVYKHNGRIWVESKGLGKGSEFYVELPVKQNK